MKKELAIVALVVTMSFTFAISEVSAHHSRAGYDTKKALTLRGTVSEIKWKNPHVFILFDVKDESGNAVQWTGELSSVTSMLAAGMSKDSFKRGDEIWVTVNPAESGLPESLIVKLARGDGTVVVSESYRTDTR